MLLPPARWVYLHSSHGITCKQTPPFCLTCNVMPAAPAAPTCAGGGSQGAEGGPSGGGCPPAASAAAADAVHSRPPDGSPPHGCSDASAPSASTQTCKEGKHSPFKDEASPWSSIMEVLSLVHVWLLLICGVTPFCLAKCGRTAWPAAYLHLTH